MGWRKQRNWKEVALLAQPWCHHHDNVTHYIAWMTRQWFKWYEWEVLQHPPHFGHQGTSNIVGLSKGLRPGSGSRKIMVLLWCLLAPCTWHFLWLRAWYPSFLLGCKPR
jgi:hypothetical protein